MSNITYTYLTDQDKAGIILSHIKSLEHTLYNLEISEIEASVIGNSETSVYAAQILESQSKIAALKQHLDLLNVDPAA